jgi:hypothetical protein
MGNTIKTKPKHFPHNGDQPRNSAQPPGGAIKTQKEYTMTTQATPVAFKSASSYRALTAAALTIGGEWSALRNAIDNARKAAGKAVCDEETLLGHLIATRRLLVSQGQVCKDISGLPARAPGQKTSLADAGASLAAFLAPAGKALGKVKVTGGN